MEIADNIQNNTEHGWILFNGNMNYIYAYIIYKHANILIMHGKKSATKY